MIQNVTTNRSPQTVMRAIQGVVNALTGAGPDRGGLARSVHLAGGVEALSNVKADFVRKASGATGEDGTTWAPLTKEYLAYQRRFGKGEKAALKKAAGLTSANRQRGLLTAAQNKRWKQVFWQVFSRLQLSLSDSEAKARASAAAWSVVKREGARTMLEVFGNRKVDINRDTGVLLNSLSPGVFDGSTYQKPSGEGGSEQIMEPIVNGVVVGTNVAYAAAVHKRRPLWTDPFPEVWTQRIANVVEQAMVIAFRLSVEAA
jgi:hypothetical protein